jgi:arylsulfatase A-like enzyme
MSSRTPNILWIVTTQWRGAAMGYAGDPNARTPHLDALAAESVNYPQAVTPHPFGPFARAAMLTGVPSPENGVRDYFDPLPWSARTVAHDLADRGYATAFFGKWHLGKRDPAVPLVGEAHAKTVIPPEARGGFGFWEGFESGFLLNDPWLQGSRLPEAVKFPGYQSDVVCERAARWMAESSEHGSESWFCVVSLEAPHPPYDAPAAGVAASDPASIILPANVPRGGEAEAKARKELAGYYAHIEATDRAIGRLWRQVTSDKGQVTSDGTARETIVVFTSVHGDMHGAHGLFRKGWPHEESVRVPLLVRVPGVAARKDDSAVSLVELRSWVAGWAEGGPANGLERGGLGIIRPTYSRISMPSVVALPHQCDRVWRGVRTKTRKLVLNADGSPWLFFDLEKDPLEMKNLAGDPARLGEMAELKEWI